MYRIGTLTDPFGEIIFQGETDSTILTLKDSYVSLVPGKRVVVSDLGQGNNQWAIVRTLGVGPPPPPPSPVGLVSIEGRGETDWYNLGVFIPCLLYTSPSPRDS